MRRETEPSHLLRGDAGLIESGGIDQIAHGFGLRQIDAAVEISAQGEFAGFGQTRARARRRASTQKPQARPARHGRKFRRHPRRCRIAARAKKVTTTWSTSAPVFVEQFGELAARAASRGSRAKAQNLFGDVACYRRRIIAQSPRPPRPGGVEIATIVSRRFMENAGEHTNPSVHPRLSGAVAGRLGEAITAAVPRGRVHGDRRRETAVPRGPLSAGRMGAGGAGGVGISAGTITTCADGAHAEAFAAQLFFVSQSEVDDAALAAGHRVEVERRACPLHFFRRSERAHAQLFDAQQAIVIGVEGERE